MDLGHDYQPGSDRGSPNDASTSLSKRVSAEMRSPTMVRRSRPAPWRMPWRRGGRPEGRLTIGASARGHSCGRGERRWRRSGPRRRGRGIRAELAAWRSRDRSTREPTASPPVIAADNADGAGRGEFTLETHCDVADSVCQRTTTNRSPPSNVRLPRMTKHGSRFPRGWRPVACESSLCLRVSRRRRGIGARTGANALRQVR